MKRFFFLVVVSALAVTAFTFIPQALSTSSASEKKAEDTPPVQKAPPPPTEKFCGWSSYGSCQSDADCFTSGCSGEVCQSANENVYNTICQSGDCYDADNYSLLCACKQNTCQWTN
ncbi:MAG: eight-cysteine-cluster domain-containing protein [Nitrospinae bacterium]|nr:eight-cysteine-cluster domain-containing protein [Nitrospinota bacterium]MBF0633841.1 eight-cysteine-cluster domain-containing protein [Nitrospinota bacterium]